MKYISLELSATIFFGLLFLSTNACVCDFVTTDSLPQLSNYDFIALVKITGDGIYKKPTKVDIETIGQVNFQIIELFKGEKIGSVLVYDINSSCDMGISPGEEWILFGKQINGKLAVTACDRNEQYKKKNELRDWKYGSGFSKLIKLQILYNHPVKTYENETRKEYYSTGQIENEETYVNGKRNGPRNIWYPNGTIFCRESYVNDTLDGKAEWFYPSGQIYDEDYYLKGRHCNVSRLYYDSSIDDNNRHWLIEDFYKTEDSLNFVYKRIQPQYEIVFDSFGNSVISREYTRLGKIHSEEIIDWDRKFRTIIYYHDNGAISSIGYTLKGKNYGHYQYYDENGFPDRGWNYDEDGNVIKLEKK